MKRFRQFASPIMVGHFMQMLADESKDIARGVRYNEEQLEVISDTILDKSSRETMKHRLWRK